MSERNPILVELCEAIGYHAAQIAAAGEMAPNTWLMRTLDKVDAALAAAPAQERIDALELEVRQLSKEIAGLRKGLNLAVRQNSHDMLMTGEELRQCEAALAGTAPAPMPAAAPQADSQPAPLSRQQICDKFSFLEGMVNEWGFDRIVSRAEEIQARAIAARAPADSVTAPAGAVDGDVDAVALTRYKVVPAHESMFHRFAVVAGDGKQQLYLGREAECENMARKFAGAFLDGAFYQSNIAPTPPAQAADSVLEDAARWEFRWLNPANNLHVAPSDLGWKTVNSKGMRSEKEVLEDLQAYRYQGKPVYEVRPLFATRALEKPEIRCPVRLANGGDCPRHNLQCGWPDCNKESK